MRETFRRLAPLGLRRALRSVVSDWRRPVLSTVVLNWNRRHLLERTINSYAATVSVPHELFIVDNGSTDGSPDLIRGFCAETANRHAIFLPENRGGEALNPVMERCRGRFIQISENDIEYLVGWDRELLSRFQVFPELGQISPFTSVPEVDKGEVWVEKPAAALERKGKVIQVAEGNVGTSCIIRREVRDRGVRWRNIESSVFRFPDDAQFSRDVKDLGYTVAWNDSYVVFHWGCNVEEYRRNLPYYIQNYADKPWMGVDGFAARLQENGYLLVQGETGEYQIVGHGETGAEH